MFRIALQYDNQAVQLWSWVELVYLFGVEATELVEKQPTNFGMLVAEVDLIKLLGLGAI